MASLQIKGKVTKVQERLEEGQSLRVIEVQYPDPSFTTLLTVVSASDPERVFGLGDEVLITLVGRA
jgi:hypothetical protein